MALSMVCIAIMCKKSANSKKHNNGGGNAYSMGMDRVPGRQQGLRHNPVHNSIRNIDPVWAMMVLN